MLSIPDYVFRVLVSIFTSKTITFEREAVNSAGKYIHKQTITFEREAINSANS